MSRDMQRKLVSPPSDKDAKLKDYSSVIQQNFEDVFEALHNHQSLISIPAANEGSIGDIVLVTLESQTYLYAKFPLGWKRILLS